MVTLARAAFEVMAAAARAAYPEECCGLLTSPADAPAASALRAPALQARLTGAHPCRNRQNEYHVRFPDEYPRDARTAYFLDYRDLERVDEEAQARGDRLVGIYHSHVDVGAYFSAEDVRVALMGGDEPAFGDFVHIVLDARKDGVPGGKAFCWDAVTRAFRELPLEVVP